MRHLGEIGKDALSCNIDAQADREFRLGRRKGRLFQDFTQTDTLKLLVRHLDADGGFSRYRLYAHGKCRKTQSQIVCQICDLADLDARRRLKLIARNSRSVACIDDLRLDLEVFQGLRQSLCVFGNFPLQREVLLLDFRCEYFFHFWQLIRHFRRLCRFFTRLCL